jgi:hypothetical protein
MKKCGGLYHVVSMRIKIILIIFLGRMAYSTDRADNVTVGSDSRHIFNR